VPDPTYPPGQLQTRLANERTLLAWLRTSVALMGFGVMIARLGVFLETLVVTSGVHSRAAGQSRITGAALLITGSVIALIGHRRTRAYARAIDPDGLPPKDGPLRFTAALVGLLGIVLAVFVALLE
jgi:putative membrane protein